MFWKNFDCYDEDMFYKKKCKKLVVSVYRMKKKNQCYQVDDCYLKKLKKENRFFYNAQKGEIIF